MRDGILKYTVWLNYKDTRILLRIESLSKGKLSWYQISISKYLKWNLYWNCFYFLSFVYYYELSIAQY